jgi:hypothetical protein
LIDAVSSGTTQLVDLPSICVRPNSWSMSASSHRDFFGENTMIFKKEKGRHAGP